MTFNSLPQRLREIYDSLAACAPLLFFRQLLTLSACCWVQGMLHTLDLSKLFRRECVISELKKLCKPSAPCDNSSAVSSPQKSSFSHSTGVWPILRVKNISENWLNGTNIVTLYSQQHTGLPYLRIYTITMHYSYFQTQICFANISSQMAASIHFPYLMCTCQCIMATKGLQYCTMKCLFWSAYQ